MKSMNSLLLILFFLIGNPLYSQKLEWKHFGDLLKARHYHNALYLGNGEILVSGGYINSRGTFIVKWSDAHLTGRPTRSAEIISLKDKSVQFTDSMAFARAEFPMLLTKNSNVVVISGITKEGGTGELTPTVEMYDRTTKRWSVIGTLIVPRRQHAAVFINDEEIIITGGRNQDVSAIAAAEIFNITTGKSRLIAPFPAALSGMFVNILSDGSIAAGAGREGGQNSNRTGEIYKYIPSSNTWKLLSALPDAIHGPSVLRLSNRHLLIAGGYESESPQRISRQILYEDDALFSSLYGSKLLTDRTCNGFIQWDSANVISVGGVTELMEGLNFTKTCEWINFKNGEISYAPMLNTERLTFATVTVPRLDESGKYIDSKVFAIGGFGIDSRNVASIEMLEKLTDPTSVSDDGNEIQFAENSLIKAFPNPADENFTLEYSLASDSQTKVSILNSLGMKKIIIDQFLKHGNHTQEVATNEFCSGLYYILIESGSRSLKLPLVIQH